MRPRLILAAAAALLAMPAAAAAHNPDGLSLHKAASLTHKLAHKAGGTHGPIGCKRLNVRRVDCQFTVRREIGHRDTPDGHPVRVVETCRYVSHVVKGGRSVRATGHAVQCVA